MIVSGREGGDEKNKSEQKMAICVCVCMKNLFANSMVRILAILQLELSKPFRHSTDDAWSFFSSSSIFK